MTIRVLITDDHIVVRKGIQALLATEPDIDVIGEAENGRQAVSEVARLRPDVVLMDMVMPEMDGAAATRLIRECCPETQIIALTSFKEEKLVHAALEAGAIGYLLKDISADEWRKIVEAQSGDDKPKKTTKKKTTKKKTKKKTAAAKS